VGGSVTVTWSWNVWDHYGESSKLEDVTGRRSRLCHRARGSGSKASRTATTAIEGRFQYRVNLSVDGVLKWSLGCPHIVSAETPNLLSSMPPKHPMPPLQLVYKQQIPHETRCYYRLQLQAISPTHFLENPLQIPVLQCLSWFYVMVR
jgi:hypothetical protein